MPQVNRLLWQHQLSTSADSTQFVIFLKTFGVKICCLLTFFFPQFLMCAAQQHITKLYGVFKVAVESVFHNSLKLLSVPKNNKNSCIVKINNDAYDFTNKRFFVIGFGKAILGMAVQLEQVFDQRLEGILSIPVGTLAQFSNNSHMKLRPDTAIQIIEGAKGNYPDAQAMKAAELIEASLKGDVKDTVIFVLVSGGGSALLPLPRPPFALQDKMALVRNLSNSGASINEMNIVRIALSRVKGGQLAAMAKQAHAMISFIISDIVGDPIELIASGPTVPFPANEIRTTPYEILRKYDLWDKLSVEQHALLKKPLPNAQNLDMIENNFHYIVANNKMAVSAAFTEAELKGYVPILLSTTLEGEVSELVEQYIKFFKLINSYRRREIEANDLCQEFPFDKQHFDNFQHALRVSSNKPLLLILAGEPTVKVSGTGLGGRNQHLALHLSYKMHACADLHDFVFFCAGTDGIDGPTPAAGAVACAQVIEDALKQDAATLESVWKYIENNDAYTFYKQLENGKYHVVTGHTGINVMDLHFIVVPPLI